MNLYDQYENQYNKNDLEEIKNNIKIQINSRLIEENKNKTQILNNNLTFFFEPIYPPKNTTINAIYLNNDKKI